MRKHTRLAMLGVAVIATSAMVGGTAGAQGAGTAADQFGARANAEALTISIGGQQLTGSNVTAELNDNPLAAATASNMLLPGVAESGLIEAKAEGVNNAGQTIQPETCMGNELEAVPGVARLDIVCPSVIARVDGELPYARGLGAEVVLEPSVSAVLDTLGLQEPVVDGADQVFEQVLDPLVQALTGTPLGELVDAEGAVQTVQDVLTDTLTLNSTARVVVAPALAEVTSTAERITATAHSQGIRIELLPVNELGATNGLLPDDLVPGEPLITITVGDAKATSVYDRVAEKVLPGEASASAVTIEFGSSALTTALGLPAEPITVAPGVEQCILTGTPLETCISVATAGTDADGNGVQDDPYATSTSISLFRGLPTGGVNLATGGVTSGSAGTGAPEPVAEAAPAGDLPRTGANPMLPVIGAGLLALAVLGRRIVVGRA
jgi:hypothetical protein